MNTIEVPQLLKSTTRCIALAALLAPATGLSQVGLDDFADREQQIADQIQLEQSRNGPYSEGLIVPLTELSLLYDEIGASIRADETIREVLTVIRANDGLETLDQAPLIRRLIGRELERGNAPAAWDLETDLLVLADRNPDDLRSAGIMRVVGDRRMEILRRYDTGEIPPEIVLGCFYDDFDEQENAYTRGSQPMNSVALGKRGNCRAGDRNHARRAVIESAQRYYRRAVNIYRLNDAESSSEFPELLMDLVRTSYLVTNPGLGAQSLRDLLDHAAEYSEGWLPQIELHIQLADWDLLYASDLGTRFEDLAFEKYRTAYDLLIEHELSDDTIDAFFAPALPVLLPSFEENPLDSPETPTSRGYIDISFVVGENGKSKRIDVLERSETVTRAEEKELVHTIKFRRFRPLMVDGQFAESEPISLRYYVND